MHPTTSLSEPTLPDPPWVDNLDASRCEIILIEPYGPLDQAKLKAMTTAALAEPRRGGINLRPARGASPAVGIGCVDAAVDVVVEAVAA